jgi:hypothetical protein
MVLSEEILPVEVVVDALVAGDIGVEVWVAGADVAAIESQLEMLNRDMTLPLVLGTESDIATIVGE